jgi:predicted glycosyltransferase
MMQDGPVAALELANGMDTPGRRIALYSPGIAGLGHMRRNLLIGQTLTCRLPGTTVLMIAEARQAGIFRMPPGMDCLTLPALRKLSDGKCQPRYLNTTLKEVIRLRADVLRAALEAFEPDLLVVDFLPRGRHGELETALASLRDRGRTRCVLGLRDVLENPAWFRGANEPDIRSIYDAVWVYGDPHVYDLVREQYFGPEVSERVRYTGYLDQRRRLEFADPEYVMIQERLGLPPGKLVLCLLGGGGDGADLAEAFAHTNLPPHTNGVLLTGPFMPPEVQDRLRRRASDHPRLRVLEFHAEPTALLSQADRIIAMGGYNTVCEILSFEKVALLVPRVEPPEQLVRAERLRALGLVDVLRPEAVRPERLAEWLASDRRAPAVHRQLDMSGLSRLPGLVEAVIAGPMLRPEGMVKYVGG